MATINEDILAKEKVTSVKMKPVETKPESAKKK